MSMDELKLAVEGLSGGTNTVLFDDLSMPSYMVKVPKMLNSEILTSGGSAVTHPGFIVNGKEEAYEYVSKYINIVSRDRAYSLPFKDPAVNIDFDNALAKCRNKGKGWGLVAFSTWAAIALWSRKNGTMPHGNLHNGADSTATWEKGILTNASDGSHRTYTGSGPVTWNHDHSPLGICDMGGDVPEWFAGVRLNNGEIQVIPNANAMLASCDMSASSSEWKAILASDGSLVAPGTAGTLKYASGSNQIGTASAGTDTGLWQPFTSMSVASGVTVPEIAKALILYPDEPGGDYRDDYHGWNTSGERVGLCSSGWGHEAYGGAFYLDLTNPRSIANSGLGFRCAYSEEAKNA